MNRSSASPASSAASSTSSIRASASSTRSPCRSTSLGAWRRDPTGAAPLSANEGALRAGPVNSFFVHDHGALLDLHEQPAVVPHFAHDTFAKGSLHRITGREPRAHRDDTRGFRCSGPRRSAPPPSGTCRRRGARRRWRAPSRAALKRAQSACRRPPSTPSAARSASAPRTKPMSRSPRRSAAISSAVARSRSSVCTPGRRVRQAPTTCARVESISVGPNPTRTFTGLPGIGLARGATAASTSTKTRPTESARRGAGIMRPELSIGGTQGNGDINRNSASAGRYRRLPGFLRRHPVLITRR